MRPKLVALIAASSVSVGWLLASVIAPPVAELQVLPERPDRPRPAPRAEATTTYTEQLHLKLQQAPQPPVTRRNPFLFGPRNAPATGTATAARQQPKDATDRETAAAPAPAPSGPNLRLSGIGSTGNVRTAVIADGTTVHLVKVGETVNGYAVIEIAEDSVIVADASGAQWRLRMR